MLSTGKISRAFLSASWSLLVVTSLSAQTTLYDDFEDGVPDGWVTALGTCEISTAQSHSGSYSVRCVDPGDGTPSVMLHETLAAFEGTYSAWFYVDDCSAGVALALFQVLDESNHYEVSCQPYDPTIDWNLSLDCIYGGDLYELNWVTDNGLIPCQQWFQVIMERSTDGGIKVSTVIGGSEVLQMTATNLYIVDYLTAGFGGRDADVYVDDISFVFGCCDGRVGDANGFGGDEPTLGDVSVMIDALFISQSPDPIMCLPEADINQSGGPDPQYTDITIGDISTLIDYLFITGPALGLPDCL